LTLSRRKLPPGIAWWWGVAGLLGAGALLAYGRSVQAIDWQPSLAVTEPWRWWSAVWVHYSAMHLWANVLGTMLVAALGWAANVPRRSSVAWLVAWPLTQLGLLAQPELLHYGGLSGVLHAGVAVVAVWLLRSGPRQRRIVGGLLLFGLCLKVLSETPWRGVLHHPAGWDIATAPFAHACGLIAGGIAGWLFAPFTPDRVSSR